MAFFYLVQSLNWGRYIVFSTHILHWLTCLINHQQNPSFSPLSISAFPSPHTLANYPSTYFSLSSLIPGTISVLLFTSIYHLTHPPTHSYLPFTTSIRRAFLSVVPLQVLIRWISYWGIVLQLDTLLDANPYLFFCLTYFCCGGQRWWARWMR